MNNLFMCGAGNSEGVRLALACNSHVRRWENILVLDDDPSRHGGDLIGIPIVGGFDALRNADPAVDQVVNLVARTTKGRAAARAKIAAYGVPFAQLVHPNVDTYSAELAEDVIVYNNATVGPEIQLGTGSVVFMGAVVGHESRVSEGCVLAANSVLNARVVLGERVYIGTNSTVLPEITVGAEATVAAGSVLIRDLDAGDTAIGVPADSMSSMALSAGSGSRLAKTSMGAGQLTTVISDIWCALLGVSDPPRSANFFDIGGNSLLAIRMQDEVGDAAGIRLATTDVFRYPTIDTLVSHLTGTVETVRPPGNERIEARKKAMRQLRVVKR
jgi:sugar O-acyltransferase (sialic acid O-acetyltransferase NeuD family)